MTRLLIVEDQKKLLKSLQRGLEDEGYDVLTAESAEQALDITNDQNLDAIVLDVMLPGRNGYEFLRDIRHRGLLSPVLMLTARDAVEDRVEGLDAGADDYLPKPFAFQELSARIRALLRRNAATELMLRAADLEMHLMSRRVTRAGSEIDLSKREFELLEYFLRHKNQPVTREAIARDVWKEKHGLLTNIIDVYINLLRKKLDVPLAEKPLIYTVRGVGYELRDAS